MTNFECYAESPYELERLLSAATDAALRAKGCSMKLDFPPDGDWEAWLKLDETGLPRPSAKSPEFLTPEQHNAKAVTDKLTEIKDAIGRFHTPFAQAVCDILDEAIEDVEMLAQ